MKRVSSFSQIFSRILFFAVHTNKIRFNICLKLVIAFIFLDIFSLDGRCNRCFIFD